jgi:hypothetical protein
MMKLDELEEAPDPDGGEFGTSLKGAFLTPFIGEYFNGLQPEYI